MDLPAATPGRISGEGGSDTECGADAVTEPRRLDPTAAEMDAVHGLLVAGFAGMEGQIDPPSSIHHTGVAELRRMAAAGPAWVLGDPPVACVFGERRGDRLYLGKLAVAQPCRGRGLARQLIAAAEAHARAADLAALELRTRVELVDNHATFARLGFRCTGQTAHPGYDRPTSLTFTKSLTPGIVTPEPPTGDRAS